MQAVRTINPGMPVRDRLSTRLGLLFVASFLGVLILLVAWTMFATVGDRREAAANSGVAAPVIVIDPKIQTDLAKALAFDALPTSGEVLNPFLDRAGLSGNVVAATTVQTSSQTPSSSAAPSTSITGAAGRTVSTQRTASQIPAASGMVEYNVKARHDDWLDRQKRGEFVVPESEVLAVEDLVPVGFASGGDRAAEVMLFSVSLCQTFSFPAGTRFANGWLSGFDQSEVVFTFQDGVRRKSYSSSEACQAPDSRLAN
ncbi:MAG TPA: hypothetical protein VMZ26_08500 [Pyrinomonadaceae bacterium]|nr:hypothetical protein [Pyrinomonadaceae bacterium]